MKTYKINLVLCFGVLLIADATCKSFTCREKIYNLKNICTISEYTSGQAADEFELTPETNSEIYNSVKNLKFTNSTVTHIPNGIFLSFEFLETLDVSNSQVVNLSETIFIFSVKLHELNLSHNLLTRIDAVFDGADSLGIIDLSHNNIIEIGVNAFKNLNKLSKIDLSYNLINIQETSVFPANLYDLNLDFNLIQNISISTNIDQISLNNNKLLYINVNSHLKLLHANNNSLKSSQLICKKCNLRSLSVKNNLLANFTAIKNMSNLTYLDVSNNQIMISNETDMFANLKQLKTLILKNVNLNYKQFELFSDLREIEMLDVSFNQLSYIDFSLISRLENLQNLKLDHNKLRSQTFNEFDYLFPALNTIDISENDWMCSHLITVLTKFKELKINIEISDRDLISTDVNIRGIRCYNNTDIMLIHELDLNMSNNTELYQVLSGLQNDTNMLRMKLKEIVDKLGDVEESNYAVDELYKAIEQLNNTLNTKNKENKLNNVESAIIQKIDNSFIELYDIKSYLIIGAAVTIILTFIATFVIYKKCQNKHFYNNYNFQALNGSNSSVEKTPYAGEKERNLMLLPQK